VIDDNLLPWPPEVDDALASFRCGIVIERPPFAYHAVGAYALWSASSLLGETEELVMMELAEEDRPPYGIITTETCDLLEEDREQKIRPWFQVSPVLDLGHLDNNAKSGIENLRYTYLSRLTGPAFLGGFYVADMRISIPVEKSALVGRMPLQGFASAEQERAFSIQIGEMATRPVWPDSVQRVIVGGLKKFFRKASRKTALRALALSDLRLAVSGPDKTPIAALLVYVSPEHEDAAQALFNAYWSDLHDEAAAAGVVLMPVRYGTDESFSSGDLRSSSTLRLPG
jgi:hypothetical protein